jgi:hypothetical protein
MNASFIIYEHLSTFKIEDSGIIFRKKNYIRMAKLKRQNPHETPQQTFLFILKINKKY